MDIELPDKKDIDIIPYYYKNKKQMNAHNPDIYDKSIERR